MLLIDGVKYKVWEPQTEDEFEKVVKEHTQDIFGEQSIYLDRKQKLRSLSGIGSIPDGYVIVLGDSPHWHIVEVELSSHDPYQHVVPQVDRFINAIDSHGTRNRIIDALYDAVDNDELLKVKTRQAIGQGKDIHKFLADLITTPPTITIIIEKDTDQLEEALRKYAQKKVIEFQTFTREGVGLAVHAHLFEPLYATPKTTIVPKQGEAVTTKDTLELTIGKSEIKWCYFNLTYGKQLFFPAPRTRFTFKTDTDEIETNVAGNEKSGYWISRKTKDWYKRHPELKVGDKLLITAIEPMKKYRLEIVK